MKTTKVFLLGLICLFTIGWAYVDNSGKAIETGKFDQPRKVDNSDSNLVVYKGEIYERIGRDIVYVPFVTDGASFITLEYYVRVMSGGRIKKGVMVVSIYDGPAFGYSITKSVYKNIVPSESFSLTDIDCDDEVDMKTSYDTVILIPDCLYKYKTSETG